jgi:hypothetical protein
MISNDFHLLHMMDERISHIKSSVPFAVEDGASQVTFQSFPATTPTSTNNVIYNVQVPSMSTVIDRNVYMQATPQLQFTIDQVPVGELAMNYGYADSLQAFPLLSLFTTMQSTINNCSITTNIKDILPQILRMYDHEKLVRYNSSTPCLPDLFFQQYSDALGTQTNPMGSFQNMSFNNDLIPRGAFPIQMDVIHTDAEGAVDESLVSTSLNDRWTIYVTFTVMEPLIGLSPFANTGNNDSAGFLGINAMTLQFNVDQSCSRVWSSAHDYIRSIRVVSFTNCALLLNLLSLQPEQYAKISAKNVLPYLDLPRYTYSSGVALAPRNQQSYTFTNIQLNQIPDLVMIVARKPMANQNWTDSSFLTIKGISINFNNQSGILSSATQTQLFQLSQKNHSSQSYYEFIGQANANVNIGADAGKGETIPSLGSLLVLNPAMDFGLNSMYSASSAGQFNFQFTLQVYNQTNENITPEICVITVNSGLFITENGVSSTQTGLLTREMVLNTKNNRAVDLDRSSYKRLIGGAFSSLRQLGSMFKKQDDGEGDMNKDAEPDGSGMAASGLRKKTRLHKFVRK